MIIIDTKEKIHELIRSLPENRKIARFVFSGDLHDGHYGILSEIRKKSDIVIADYIEHVHYFDNMYTQGCHEFGQYDHIIKSAEGNNDIDYLVINKIYPDDHNVQIYRNSKYKVSKVVKECNRLNLSMHIAKEACYALAMNRLDEYTTSICGPKILLPVMIYKKVLYPYDLSMPSPVWKFVKNDNGDVISRFKIDQTLSRAKQIAVQELKSGSTKTNEFETPLFDYYIENPMFSILDLNTLERLSEINDNCVLVFMSTKNTEYIFIRKGKVVE